MNTVFLSPAAFQDLVRLDISRRRSAYLARYAWDDALDRVMVARIRHQREAGDQDGEV